MPVRPTAPPTPAPSPLATTPPPVGDLNLSSSSWSDADDFPATRRSPRVGDTILGFKLIAELGRGAFARVFLAHQEALANRPVALKVTLRPTHEAERLARLQHTNIVPVYSVHNDAPVQVICMPYLGRTTLADLIRAFRVEHPSRLSGRKSTSARAARTTAHDSRSKSGLKYGADSKGNSGTARIPTWTWAAGGPPPIVGDPRAVLEVLVQLAAGLTHAHERGILHLDIKPANVLLADTGEPMLLDFNLSFDAARPNRDLVGGTMPYMAIEQLLDMRNRGKGEIDARTDLYSLGVLAFEMLTGTVPFPVSGKQSRDLEGQVAARRKGPPSIRALNPAVSPAVEAIILKLLAAEPVDRYQNAEELRIDAERQLNDLPLQYAREASTRERFAKWRRRNPGFMWRMLVACVIGLTIGLGGAVQRRAEATARYEAVEQAKQTHVGLETTRLDLVLPDDAKARARGTKRATESLAVYGLPGDANWQKRDDVRRLSEAERVSLAGDLGELMFLLAQAKWREAEARPDAERRELATEAWKLNSAARACFTPGSIPAALDVLAASIAPAAGETFEKPEKPEAPTQPRGLFLDAAHAVAHGRYSAAIPLLDRVIADQPEHGAAQFCLAYCRQQNGEYVRALERYDTARVLLPNDPRPAYHRGAVYAITKQPAKAEAEYTKAIALDENHADAYRHRAMARYRLGVQKDGVKGAEKEVAAKYAEAEADLTAAGERGAPMMYIHFVRSRVRDARGNAAGAAADRDATKDAVLKTEYDYLVRGWMRLETDAKGALADFRKAAEINPRSLVALQNQAHILADKMKDDEAALVVATKAAQLYPEFAPALAGRAVLLARVGQRDESHKIIAKALLLSEDAEIVYQAASVYAVTSRKEKDDLPEAIKLLREAFRKGYADFRGLDTDEDMKDLRDNIEFQRARGAAITLSR